MDHISLSSTSKTATTTLLTQAEAAERYVRQFDRTEYPSIREAFEAGWQGRGEQDAREIARYEREITAVLDQLGRKAVRVREGGGPENLLASLAVTLAQWNP